MPQLRHGDPVFIMAQESNHITTEAGGRSRRRQSAQTSFPLGRAPSLDRPARAGISAD